MEKFKIHLIAGLPLATIKYFSKFKCYGYDFVVHRPYQEYGQRHFKATMYKYGISCSFGMPQTRKECIAMTKNSLHFIGKEKFLKRLKSLIKSRKLKVINEGKPE